MSLYLRLSFCLSTSPCLIDFSISSHLQNFQHRNQLRLFYLFYSFCLFYRHLLQSYLLLPSIIVHLGNIARQILAKDVFHHWLRLLRMLKFLIYCLHQLCATQQVEHDLLEREHNYNFRLTLKALDYFKIFLIIPRLKTEQKCYPRHRCQIPILWHAHSSASFYHHLHLHFHLQHCFFVSYFDHIYLPQGKVSFDLVLPLTSSSSPFLHLLETFSRQNRTETDHTVHL